MHLLLQVSPDLEAPETYLTPSKIELDMSDFSLTLTSTSGKPKRITNQTEVQAVIDFVANHNEKEGHEEGEGVHVEVVLNPLNETSRHVIQA